MIKKNSNSLLPSNLDTMPNDVLITLIKAIDKEYQNAMKQVSDLTLEVDTVKVRAVKHETVKKNNSQVEKLNRLLLRELMSLRVGKSKGCKHCHKTNIIHKALTPNGLGVGIGLN